MATSDSVATYEACNEVDDDCDGATDEDVLPTWYADADGDGWGDAASTFSSCDAPSGYVADSTDCDDTTAAVSPGFGEVCDELDNDCDGFVDDGVTTTFYADRDSDGYGDATRSMEACWAPTGYATNALDCDDGDSTRSPGLAEGCFDAVDNDCDTDVDEGCLVEHCGTITADETWTPAVTHVVTCDVYVEGPGAPVLTIEDSTTVSFAPGSGLYVGVSAPGTLLVSGSRAGVKLLPEDPTVCTPGSWDGVYLGPYDGGSVLGFSLIWCAGGNGYGALAVATSGAVSASGVHIDASSTRGVYVASGELALSGSIVENCLDDGVWVASSASLAGSTPSFQGNMIDSNGNYGLVLPADSLGELYDNSILLNGLPNIQVLGGTVSRSGSWTDQGEPFQVTGDVTIEGPSSPTVRIEDGVTLLFDPGAGLYIGATAPGALVIEGTTEGISMSSSAASPAPGDWVGLDFGYYTDSASCSVERLFLDYAGSGGYGALTTENASFPITYAWIRESGSAGLYVASGTLSVDHATISGSVGDGVYVTSAGALGTFVENDLAYNLGHAITLPASAVAALDDSNDFVPSGDRGIAILGGNVETTATWIEEDYAVEGTVAVIGDTAPVLTLLAGSSFYFDPGTALRVGDTNYGSLAVAGGVGPDTVLLSSSASSPAAGDWQGVYLGSLCDPAATALTGVTVEYGGANGYGNVVFDRCNGSLTNATITNSSTYGIWLAGASPTLSAITYADNLLGDVN